MNENPTAPTDDMVTVHLDASLTVTVSQSAWAGEWSLDPANGPAVQEDLRIYMKDHVMECLTSSVVASLGGTLTRTVVDRPRNELLVNGQDLFRLLWSLSGSRPTPQRAERLQSLRLNPRPDGFAYKVNDSAWSPTVGKRVAPGQND